ncbi:hypothetical protein O181_104237, partial [Austropuccinia psidii MF-1]|nr:hypothetical protein [Austropuccinia psidii MF-1]
KKRITQSKISFKEEVSHKEISDENQVKDKPLCLVEKPLQLELPCSTLTREDKEHSSREVQNINEDDIDEPTFENSKKTLSQMTIRMDLNQQKTLHPKDKSSGEANNNFNIEKKLIQD